MIRKPDPFSRREREIMRIIFRHGKASASEVRQEMHEPPSDSAVRAMLRILEEKGHLTHEQDGLRYVYIATRRRDEARRSALRDVLTTFFDGSPARVMATLLDEHRARLSAEDLDELERAIERARKEGR